ncbi:helix-turn-helix domain-containing protein [Abyssogena phaseoliformis symbiont]|uniref:helix-turn-helix domain-containing protein n=1 Tax=Abyssogena phaseoliformis symbiont TaxID=596095 RepID=UPI001914E9B4|nr:helix-turn-helix transcriptional regulator [Abyssogena phaseoliformis symbiont]
MNINFTKNDFIGERIKIAREKNKLNRKNLAEIMCLSGTIVGKWERGNSNPSTAHLIKLAKVLNVSFEWLATGVENEGEKTVLTEKEKETLHNTQVTKISVLMEKMSPKQKESLVAFLGDMTI